MSDQLANFLLVCFGIPLFLVAGLVFFCAGIAVLDAINTYCGGRNIDRVLDRFRQNRDRN